MKDRSKDFSTRHIGIKDTEAQLMLQELGYDNMDKFLKDLMPESIFDLNALKLPEPLDEASALKNLKAILFS